MENTNIHEMKLKLKIILIETDLSGFVGLSALGFDFLFRMRPRKPLQNQS